MGELDNEKNRWPSLVIYLLRPYTAAVRPEAAQIILQRLPALIALMSHDLRMVACSDALRVALKSGVCNTGAPLKDWCVRLSQDHESLRQRVHRAMRERGSMRVQLTMEKGARAARLRPLPFDDDCLITFDQISVDALVRPFEQRPDVLRFFPRANTNPPPGLFDSPDPYWLPDVHRLP